MIGGAVRFFRICENRRRCYDDRPQNEVLKIIRAIVDCIGLCA